MRLEGYERKQELIKIQNLEAWKQTRLIAYSVAKPYLNIQSLSLYDFLPLPGDPTEEQQLEALKKKKEDEGAHVRALIDKYKKIK